MTKTREEIIEIMAESYYKLLNALSSIPDNDYIFDGLREGLNKFLSNLYIKLNDNDKYKTDYISEVAKSRLENGQKESLVFEHMIPKSKYIQNEFLEAAKKGKTLSKDEIQKRLMDFWKIALVTSDEDKKLTDCGFRSKMPNDWDGKDILVRYKAAGIKLLERK